MKCSKFQEQISLEMDGQLAPEHVPALQRHLETCPECRAYREDLMIGLRMLNATEPELPDNFDWKLQLRLSQAMREAARDTSYPWQEVAGGWRRWLGRAGVAAAVGLATVLSVAMIAPGHLVPAFGGDAQMAIADPVSRLPIQTVASTDGLLADTTRRPLDGRYTRGFNPFGGGLQRTVSSDGGFGNNSWSGANDRDLLRIRRLEQDLESLKRRLSATDRQNRELQAKLDSLTGRGVDTQ